MLLDSHAPMKERCVRCNQKRFRSNEIDKAMMMTLFLKQFKKYFFNEINKACLNEQIFL